jgi:hypothetical protein
MVTCKRERKKACVSFKLFRYKRKKETVLTVLDYNDWNEKLRGGKTNIVFRGN